MYTVLVKCMHPAASKVEKVNGGLIKNLGSRHAGLPTHYSSLNGGPLPKGEHNMIVSLGCQWRGWSSWQNLFCTIKPKLVQGKKHTKTHLKSTSWECCECCRSAFAQIKMNLQQMALMSITFDDSVDSGLFMSLKQHNYHHCTGEKNQQKRISHNLQATLWYLDYFGPIKMHPGHRTHHSVTHSHHSGSLSMWAFWDCWRKTCKLIIRCASHCTKYMMQQKKFVSRSDLISKRVKMLLLKGLLAIKKLEHLHQFWSENRYMTFFTTL